MWVSGDWAICVDSSLSSITRFGCANGGLETKPCEYAYGGPKRTILYWIKLGRDNWYQSRGRLSSKGGGMVSPTSLMWVSEDWAICVDSLSSIMRFWYANGGLETKLCRYTYGGPKRTILYWIRWVVTQPVSEFVFYRTRKMPFCEK